MKTLPLLLCGVSLFAMAQSLSAQTKNQPPAGDPFLKNPAEANVPGKGGDTTLQNYQLLLEVYSLDKNEANILLESETGSAARYRAISDLTQSGKAKLDILTALTTKSEYEAQLLAVDELRYATEFEPPVKINEPAIPCGFAARNSGDVLKFTIDARAEGRPWNLILAIERITLLRFDEISAMPGAFSVTQPRFNVQKYLTSVSFPFNETHFLGSLSESTVRGVANGEAPSEVRLAFVRVQQMNPKADDLKKPAKPLDWSAVNLEYRIFSLEPTAARELFVSSLDSQSFWQNLQPLVSKKRARLEHLFAIQCEPGKEAATDEIQEVRYATEYVHLSTKDVENVETTPPTKNAAPVTEKEDANSPTNAPAKVASSSANTLQPTDFGIQRRDVGVKLKVTPTIVGDGLFVDLEQDLDSIAYLGDLKAKGLPGHHPRQPVFESRQLHSSEVLTSGKQTLVGTLNPPSANGVNNRTDQDRIWLVFVRATPNER